MPAPAPRTCPVFLRADEGFWGQDFFAELERRQITYAVGAPLIASVRGPDQRDRRRDWQPRATATAARSPASAGSRRRWKQERRFIVRRDPVERRRAAHARRPRVALLGARHQRPRTLSADELERWHRAKANVENQIKEAKLGLGLDNLPCHSFHANWAYLLCTLLAYNLLAWLKLLALPARDAAATRNGSASASSPSPPPSAAPGEGSSCGSPPATRSSPTSSPRCNGSADWRAPA